MCMPFLSLIIERWRVLKILLSFGCNSLLYSFNSPVISFNLLHLRSPASNGDDERPPSFYCFLPSVT
ncbi:Uncharacterized protein APZ42_026086 [Daphnia magna]|uniref:Uncharacterized protein n=1 Tax=Daphnia magna TaxID=35525 RepID=A0A162DBS0_9CRUS|nr:Uncharacterized protein APZ42_026086 [Daphnia magna]